MPKPKPQPKKPVQKPFVHKTAFVEEDAKIGEGTKIWHQSQIRKSAKIGKNCVISKNVFIDHDVEIGDNCKIQNNCSIFYQTFIEEGVFVGPHVCFTNDKIPRAIEPSGKIKTVGNWHISTTRIKKGASVGAHSVILPEVTIGEFAMIGAGSVITHDVPDHALVYGNPARIRDFVCKCGKKLKKTGEDKDLILLSCECGLNYQILEEIYKQKEETKDKKRIWIR